MLQMLSERTNNVFEQNKTIEQKQNKTIFDYMLLIFLYRPTTDFYCRFKFIKFIVDSVSFIYILLCKLSAFLQIKKVILFAQIEWFVQIIHKSNDYQSFDYIHIQ